MVLPVSILIVDDNLLFLNALSSFLADHYANQIQILGMAHNGLDSIHLAEQHRPQVILLDLLMPDTSGFMLIPQLRQILPDVKIIITTLLSSENFTRMGNLYCQECLKAGADAFIPKYLLNKELAPIVLEMINPVHPAQARD